MDDEPPITAELDSKHQAEVEADFESTQDEPGSTRDQSFGAFFHGSHNFSVSGGQFRNITNINQAAPHLPSDFRRIPIGDLDLRNEIRLVESGEVYRNHGRCSVRRIYSARIHGSKSKMTATVYQGENAEEEWRKDISRYSGLRHPNFVQLFGMASACGMHAAIFTDELIPMQQLLEKYNGSHSRTVHLLNFRDIEFKGASNYIHSVSGFLLNAMHCTMWIRPSTGRLCVDPTDRAYGSALTYDHYLTWDASFSSNLSVLEAPEDSKIVDSISLDRYHDICSFHLQDYRQLSISTNVSVQLGAVILCPPGSDIDLSNEIGRIPDPDINDCIPDPDINDLDWTVYGRSSVLDSGWTRVDSSEVSDGDIDYHIYTTGSVPEKAWLAQANRIFHRLGITFNHDDYVLVNDIIYTIRFATANSIPSGYLFLCPLADLQADTPSRFRLPECPAFWSLNPTGNERLSMEEAERLGFPDLESKMEVRGLWWEENVYGGLRQFHQAKGFDPDSLDVARELGVPLYEISTELGGAFAYIQEINVGDGGTETQEVWDTELPQEPVHGESGVPAPPVTSFNTAHQMNYFGAYTQGSAIEESFGPHDFGSSPPGAGNSQNSNNFNFNFEFPFRDQPYHLPPLEASTLSQFTQPDVAGSSFNYPGPSGVQFTTPPPFLWSAFPRLPPIPAPASSSRLLNPIAAHLDHRPASGSAKRKSRDDDPTIDSEIHTRRPRKMPKRADLWGV